MTNYHQQSHYLMIGLRGEVTDPVKSVVSFFKNIPSMMAYRVGLSFFTQFLNGFELPEQDYIMLIIAFPLSNFRHSQ